MVSSAPIAGEPGSAAQQEKDGHMTILGGEVSPGHYPVGAPSPLVSVPDPDDSALQWDCGVIMHGLDFGMNGKLERRHSGWEAVEQEWFKRRRESADEGQSPRQGHREPSRKKSKINSSSSGELPGAARKPREEGTTMISDGRSPAYPCPELSIPPPRLEPGSDRFRLRIALGAGGTDAVASSGPGSGSETPPGPFPSVGKRCTMLSGGTWSGTFGRGTIVSGDQETQDAAHGATQGLQIESTLRLKTDDSTPAYIECAVRGSLTGSGEAVEAMRDTGTGAPPVDPAQYNCRVVFTMETPDERYAERLNFGLWVASCVRKGQDVICE